MTTEVDKTEKYVLEPIVATTYSVTQQEIKNLLQKIYISIFPSIIFSEIGIILEYLELTDEEQIFERLSIMKNGCPRSQFRQSYPGELLRRCSICDTGHDVTLVKRTSIIYFKCSNVICKNLDEIFYNYWLLRKFQIMSILPEWNNQVIFIPKEYFLCLDEMKTQDSSTSLSTLKTLEITERTVGWRWHPKFKCAVFVFCQLNAENINNFIDFKEYFVKVEEFWKLFPEWEFPWWSFFRRIFYLHNQYYFGQNEELVNYIDELGKLMERKYPSLSFQYIRNIDDYQTYVKQNKKEVNIRKL